MRDDWELIDHWREALNANLAADGYFVGWRDVPMKVGERFPDIEGAECGMEFFIIGEATREDAVRQFSRLVKFTNPGDALVAPPDGGFFYKMRPKGDQRGAAA
jgi:hypothetical protein